MNSTQTNNTRRPARRRVVNARTILTLVALVSLFFSIAADGFAQKGFSKKYPARRNIRLHLTNLFGTITVETWNREEIKISAEMYPPIAQFTPEQTDDTFVIDVRSANRGRADVGDVNFKITVPVNSTVDIETRRGNISIEGVQGAMVRAKVWTTGEIELTNIGASRVLAENLTGNIFYDGQLVSGGKYEFKTMRGDVTIRLPADASFSLMAAAPATRNINLGMFASQGLNLGDGRKVYGNVGEARCSVVVFNQRGNITFIRR